MSTDRHEAQVARYALDGAALPSVTWTVWLAEALREAIQSRYGRLAAGEASPVFSGHGTAGRRLQGHGHARYLPVDEDGDGRLDHLTVVSVWGFTAQEQRSLLAVDHIRVGPERKAIRLRPLGVMGLESLRRESGPGAALFGAHLEWESVTPFLLSRHPKRHSDGSEDQLRREAALAGMPAIASVQSTKRPCGARGPPWASFRHARRRGPMPATPLAFGFRIRFVQPVSGPLALGYASHFGLGLFAGAGTPLW